MDKLEVARRQLGTALHLYIENLDPVSVHTLAGAAREVIERLAARAGVTTFKDHATAANLGITDKEFWKVVNLHRNAMKHADEARETLDKKLLAQFTDQHNMHLMYIYWTDYCALTGHLPIEAQHFLVWCALHSPPDVHLKLRRMWDCFGHDLMSLSLADRKWRLKNAIRSARSSTDVMTAPETERIPLVFRA